VDRGVVVRLRTCHLSSYTVQTVLFRQYRDVPVIWARDTRHDMDIKDPVLSVSLVFTTTFSPPTTGSISSCGRVVRGTVLFKCGRRPRYCWNGVSTALYTANLRFCGLDWMLEASTDNVSRSLDSFSSSRRQLVRPLHRPLPKVRFADAGSRSPILCPLARPTDFRQFPLVDVAHGTLILCI